MFVARSPKLGAASLAGIGMIFVGMLAMVFAGLGVSVAGATKPNPEHKVTLCHRTGSYSNPYVTITVDIASVLKHAGHDEHNGPVFFPAIPKHVKWGDIIPAFDYGPGRQYAGQNTGTAGQAILVNGCSLVQASTTTATTTPDSSTTTSTTAPESIDTIATTTTTGPDDTTTTGPDDTTTTGVDDTTTSSSNGPIGGLGTPGPDGPGVPGVSVGGISAGSGSLPRTGAPVFVLFGIGAALVASGIGLVVRRHRWAS